MMEQLPVQEQIEEKAIAVLKEEVISWKTKRVMRPFMVSMPRSANDLKVVYDTLSPQFIRKEMDEYGGREFVGAIAYKINEYDDIFRQYNKRYGQTTLQNVDFMNEMRDYFSKSKLKIVEPNTEVFRLRDWEAIAKFQKIDIPDYLREYLIKFRAADKNDLESIHTLFWRGLFAMAKGQRLQISHFIAWTKKECVDDRHSDVFLAPVPLIRNCKYKDELIKYTSDTNSIAYSLYGDGVACYILMDMGLFRDSQAIDQITKIIYSTKSRFIVIKILNSKTITETGYGGYARTNFEYFLRALKDVKAQNPEKIVGLLDGGGFGYCLLGAGMIDYFTDTVNNYPQGSKPFAIQKLKPRGLLHPTTLTIEPIEGVVQHQEQNDGELFYKNSIANRYKGVSPLSVDRTTWSIDARKMGLLMWQQRMAALINTHKLGLDKMRFDEVLNSDYAIIGAIVKRLINS